MRRSYRRTLSVAAAALAGGLALLRGTPSPEPLAPAARPAPAASRVDASGPAAPAPRPTARVGRAPSAARRAVAPPAVARGRAALRPTGTRRFVSQPDRAPTPSNPTRGAPSPVLAATPPPVFAIYPRPDDPAVAVLGFDPEAPRDLLLWRLDASRRHAAVAARTHSGEGGGFAIDRLLLSVQGGWLVVTGAGGDPFGDGASQAVAYPSRPRPAAEPRPRDLVSEEAP